MTLLPPDRVNLHGQDTGREALSHTRLGVLLACQQRYRWRYEERLEPAVKRAPLTMGAAFATALETASPQAGFDKVMRDHADAQTLHAGNPWVVVPDTADAEIAATTVLAAAGAYLKHFGHTDVEREVTIRSRLRNPDTGGVSHTFDVQARIDGLAGDRLIEDKLSAKVDAATERRLLLDRQVTIGAYLVWRSTGQMIREVSYRVTRKPTIKRRQNEGHDEYLERIVTDYQERGEDFYLHEFTLTRTADDFERLEAELWAWAESIRQARERGTFPRNTDSCTQWGGAGCEFLSACCESPGWQSEYVERAPREAVTADAARAAAAWRAEHLPFTNEQRDVRAPVDPRFVNEKKEAA